MDEERDIDARYKPLTHQAGTKNYFMTAMLKHFLQSQGLGEMSSTLALYDKHYLHFSKSFLKSYNIFICVQSYMVYVAKP